MVTRHERLGRNSRSNPRRRAAAGLDSRINEVAYEVVLDDAGRLRWIDRNTEPETIYEKEPDTSWWLRFKAGFYRVLPIREQL